MNKNEITPYHAKFYAYDILKKTRSDIATTLFNAKVQMNPHQVMAAQFALKSPLSKGVILADEVGLGKTIEAGLVLAQFWAENKRKIIIICPAVLRKQWQEELRNKFALDSVILDTKTIVNFEKDGINFKNEIFGHKVLICSYHFCLNPKNRALLESLNFHLAMFDEAHKLRIPKKKKSDTLSIYETLDQIFGYCRKILLTATPFQNRLSELFDLVSFVDKDILYSAQALRNPKPSQLSALRLQIKPVCYRTLRKDVVSFIKYTERHSHTFEYSSTEFERQTYKRINDFVFDHLCNFYDERVLPMLAVSLLKIKSSSSHAILATLKKVSSRIDEPIDDLDLDYNNIEDFEDDEVSASINNNVKHTQIESQQEVASIIQDLEILVNNRIDSKLSNLLDAIKFGFARMKELGAKEKCVIFTESFQTQQFLKRYLIEKGYGDKLVLFNGENKDEESNAIYQNWVNIKANHSKISGVKAADKKQAIIDYFAKTGKILLATDAAAEGVNLQFCSFLINYDLPWNPQRIEQRIGRIHRYGQKFDVVVINFVDQKNLIDDRVYKLLSDKLRLFDGVFGASNEVLGQINDGATGFSSAIYKIMSTCRDEEQINREFDLLSEQFAPINNQKVRDAKEILNQYFDEDVHNLLQDSEHSNTQRLDQISEKFWKLSKHQLGQLKISFDEENKIIDLQQQFNGIRPNKFYLINKSDWENQQGISNNQLYRINHPLGEVVINNAKSLATPNALLRFNLSNYGKIVNLLEPYKDTRGIISLDYMKINTNDFNEDFLVFSGVLDNGESMPQEVCERLFNLSATLMSSGNLENISQLQEKNRQKALQQYEKFKSDNFDEEYHKINFYQQNMLDDFDARIDEFNEQIKELNKQMRNTTNMQEKVAKTQEIAKINKKKRQLQEEKNQKEIDFEDNQSALIEQISQLLEPNIDVENLFTVRFEVV